MAALQAERAYESDWQRPTRPNLVLCDVTQEPRPMRRNVARQWNRVLFFVTLCAITLCILGVGVQSLHRTAAANAPQTLAASSLTVRVAKGDTLWRYAARYGDPKQYILDRVDFLARANHLSASMALHPGQLLRIPVQNPAALASLPHHTPRV